MIPAFVGFITILFIPKYMIHKYIYFAYSLMLILFLNPPFLFETIAGTHRWINFGLPVSIQPSEFAKLFVVVALARYLSDHNLQMKRFMTILFPILIALIPAVIVLQQPDLGTAIILFYTYFAYVILGRRQTISFVHTGGSFTKYCYGIFILPLLLYGPNFNG
ncbi:MAG: hypothetical protein CM1200mP10_05770 [Candidatus Neomarinimicrobiota bacterium]|nr:MAG: hypothetical protein CM1200mP10_05770 [Candidatus Neomarinimicrobiota bacterium]